MIPRIREHAMVVMVIFPKVRDKPPIPEIKMVETTYKFLLTSRSALWIILRPETAINPYNAIHTPPMTQHGIDEMKAINGDRKEIKMHSIAVARMVAVLAFLVMATHATLSPYVVFGHPPKKAPIIEPTPSPRRVLCKPGSSSKSLSIIEEIFL